MSGLPFGWVKARVGEVIEFGPRTDREDDTVVGFVPLQRLGLTYRSRHSFEPRPWAKVKRGYSHFADGDVLLARITPSFENGKAGIARGLPSGVGAGSTEYFVCRPHRDVLLPEILLAHFKTRQFLLEGEQLMSGAVGQQRVPKQYVLDSEIPLPPVAEQKRIAEKLDALLARVDACRERLDRVPVILKRFRHSVLAAAASGDLTGEWRAARGGPPWERCTLNEVCRSVTDGDHQAPPRATAGVPFVTISAMSDGVLRVDRASRFVPRSYFDALKPDRQAARGDVLFSVTGSLGIAALVEDNAPFVFQRHIAILKPNPKRIMSRFLRYRLEADDINKQCHEVATGTAQLTIPLSGLRGLRFDLPLLEEQQEIVSRVDALLERADRLGARLSSAQAIVQRVTPSALAKAFRGELVPQDPNDESASERLARVKALPPALKGAKNPRRQTRERRKGRTMGTNKRDAVKEVILKLETRRFSFDELSKHVAGDYESLRAALFELLEEPTPIVRQVFDKKVKAMQLERVSP